MVSRGKQRNGHIRSIKSIQALGVAGRLVVVFGAVSWLVTSRIAPAPPTHSHPATFTPGPTPEPPVCVSTELALTGVLNECATEVPEEKLACSVACDTLDAQVRLAGDNEAFLLYISLSRQRHDERR
jgi:hypothetical protein